MPRRRERSVLGCRSAAALTFDPTTDRLNARMTVAGVALGLTPAGGAADADAEDEPE
jgi:hypothetical protein